MSLEREIEDLLALDHSPEFVARVRQRIAVEPRAAATWFSWRLVPLGAGVAAVAIAVLLWPAGEMAPGSGLQAPGESPGYASRPVAAQVHASSAVASEAVAPPRPLTRVPPLRARAPEVLLSANDRRAFNLLLMRLREDRLPDLGDAVAAADATGPAWIEIAPVVIEPLAQLAQPEGERQ